ncbi:MAG TPA: hypothetical protein VGK86_11970 [Thermoanaerobaculia bacterium]
MTEEEPMADKWTPEEDSMMDEWTPEQEPMTHERTPEEEPVNEDWPPADENRTGKPARPVTVAVGIGVNPSVGQLDGVSRSVS